MVYLDHLGQSILFGGQGTDNGFLDDIWSYSNRRWQQLRPRGDVPSARCGHAMTYDDHAKQLVLFGGIDPDDNPLGDTWVFDGNTWKSIRGSTPTPRRYAAFAYDPARKGCVLHGGADDDRGRLVYGDAWLLKDGKWEQLAKGFHTTPRDDHGMGYHHGAKRLILLEGVQAARGLLGSGPDGWKSLDVNPLHPRHQCSPLVWHDDLGGLLLHGGEAGHGGQQFDATLVLHLPLG